MNRWYYRGGQNDCDTYTGCVKWGMGGVGCANESHNINRVVVEWGMGEGGAQEGTECQETATECREVGGEVN